MPPIHRLLCTHCTFETSELETHGRAQGYSVRKSSLTDADRGQLEELFRVVERLLSYKLPKDLKKEQEFSLAADSAPRQLIFVPNLHGLQVAGQVSHRSRDTHGRPDSFFADMLVERARDAAPAWSAIDILQLWSTGRDRRTCPGADWWISSEDQVCALEAENPWKPPALTAVAELRAGKAPLLDDALLHRFLTAEPGTGEASGDPLVPERWWRMAAAARRGFVEAVLHAAIVRGDRETVTIAAEPSVAAVVFYAVCRLLPRPLAMGLSFSTYESHPERPLTILVATTFVDEESPTADLPPELYQRGFACNTFLDLAKRGCRRAPPESGYACHVVDLASRAAWDELDDFLGAIGDTAGLGPASLDSLIEHEQAVAAYLQGRQAGRLDAAEGSVAARFRRRRFLAAIEAGFVSRVEWPPDLLDVAIAWVGDDLSEEWDKSPVVRDVLARCLPADGEGLKKLLSDTAPVAPPCVRVEAVVAAALRRKPPQIPREFTDYCREAVSDSKKGDASQRRAEAARLVGEFVRRLPDTDRRGVLLTTFSSAFTDLLLEAVRDLDAAECDRLELPLAELLDLVVGKSSDKPGQGEKPLVELLERHAPVADRVSHRHQGLRSKLRELFIRLTVPDDGQLLARNGRSRLPGLNKWLAHAGLDPNLTSRFHAWARLHEAALSLAALAKESRVRFGRTPPPPPEADAPLLQAVEAIEALKPLDGRGSGDGSRKTCLAARQALAFRTFSALGITKDVNAVPLTWVKDGIAARLPKPPPVKKQRPERADDPWPIHVTIAAVASVALGLVVVTGAWLWMNASSEEPQQPQVADASAGQRVDAGKHERDDASAASTPPANHSAPPNKEAAKPAHVGGRKESKPSAVAETPDPKPVASVGTVKPSAAVVDAAIQVKWIRRPDLSETPVVKMTDPRSAVQEVPVDLRTGTTSISTKGRGHGTYKLEWRANSTAGWEPLPDVNLPPPGEVCTQPSTSVVRLGDDKPDTVTVCLTMGATPDVERYGTIRYELLKVEKGNPLEPAVAESTLRDGTELRFDLNRKDYNPSVLKNGTFLLRLHTEQAHVDGTSTVTVSVPSVRQAFDDYLDGCGIPGADHHYACDLGKLSPGEPVRLFEIPWSFDAWDELQLSLLEPRGAAEPSESLVIKRAEPAANKPSRWQCETRSIRQVGYFEVVQSDQDPWKKTLTFKASKDCDQASFDRLRASQMQIAIGDGRWSLQFLQPIKLGPMRLAFEVDGPGKKGPKDDRRVEAFLPLRAQLAPALKGTRGHEHQGLLDRYQDSLLFVSGACDLPQEMRLEFIRDEKAKTAMRVSFRGTAMAQSQVVFKPNACIEITEPRLLKKNQKGEFYADSSFLRSVKNVRDKAEKEEQEREGLVENKETTQEQVEDLQRQIEELEKKGPQERKKGELEERKQKLSDASQHLRIIITSIEGLAMPSCDQLACIDALEKATVSTSQWSVALDVVGHDPEGKPLRDTFGRVIMFYGSDDKESEALKFESIWP